VSERPLHRLPADQEEKSQGPDKLSIGLGESPVIGSGPYSQGSVVASATSCCICLRLWTAQVTTSSWCRASLVGQYELEPAGLNPIGSDEQQHLSIDDDPISGRHDL
jgi:hypothetical protein